MWLTAPGSCNPKPADDQKTSEITYSYSINYYFLIKYLHVVASRGPCVADTVRWLLGQEGACWVLAGKFPESAAGDLLRWRFTGSGATFWWSEETWNGRVWIFCRAARSKVFELGWKWHTSMFNFSVLKSPSGGGGGWRKSHFWIFYLSLFPVFFLLFSDINSVIAHYFWINLCTLIFFFDKRQKIFGCDRFRAASLQPECFPVGVCFMLADTLL